MKPGKRVIYFFLLLPFCCVAGEEPDIRSVPPDLTIPALAEKGAPARAGSRFRYVHPDWEGTGVYAVVYLPKDWQPGGSFPVIAELPGNGGFKNRFGDTCSGSPGRLQARLRDRTWIDRMDRAPLVAHLS